MIYQVLCPWYCRLHASNCLSQSSLYSCIAEVWMLWRFGRDTAQIVMRLLLDFCNIVKRCTHAKYAISDVSGYTVFLGCKACKV